MRHVLGSCVVWLAGVASVPAQVSERLEIGAIVHRRRAGCLEVLTPKSAMLISEET
jgi:hypothetical protein